MGRENVKDIQKINKICYCLGGWEFPPIKALKKKTLEMVQLCRYNYTYNESILCLNARVPEAQLVRAFNWTVFRRPTFKYLVNLKVITFLHQVLCKKKNTFRSTFLSFISLSSNGTSQYQSAQSSWFSNRVTGDLGPSCRAKWHHTIVYSLLLCSFQ